MKTESDSLKPHEGRQDASCAPTDPTRDLCSQADRIQGCVRQLENLVMGDALRLLHERAQQAGERPNLMRDIQISRPAKLKNDALFSIIANHLAAGRAEDVADADPLLRELSGRMAAIKKREGLRDEEHFAPKNPGVPQEWLALQDQWRRRADELKDAASIVWLRRHGEDSMADLLATDKAEYERRRREGQIQLSQQSPKPATCERPTGPGQAATARKTMEEPR